MLNTVIGCIDKSALIHKKMWLSSKLKNENKEIDHLYQDLETLNETKANFANSKSEVISQNFKMKNFIKDVKKGILYTEKDVEILMQHSDDMKKRRFKAELYLKEKHGIRKRIKAELKHQSKLINELTHLISLKLKIKINFIIIKYKEWFLQKDGTCEDQGKFRKSNQVYSRIVTITSYFSIFPSAKLKKEIDYEL